MINDKEIEEAADKYCYETGSLYFDYTEASNEIMQAFTAGANWMQEKIMSEASEGFKEWFQSVFHSVEFENEEMYASCKYENSQAWNAAKLSSSKEIEQLKQRLEIAVSVIEHIGDHCYDYKDYCGQALRKVNS